MNDNEIRTSYDLSSFRKVDEFQFEMPSGGLMTDDELVEAIGEVEFNEDDSWFWEKAIREYGNRHLYGISVECLENEQGTKLWHTADTLYMTDNDEGLRFDLYFDHEPDEDDVIEAICIAENITEG